MTSYGLPLLPFLLTLLIIVILLLFIIAGVCKFKARRSRAADSNQSTETSINQNHRPTSVNLHQADSRPDDVTCLRQQFHPVSGRTNPSYIPDILVFNPLYEAPPPSYSDVYPADSTP